MTRYVTPCGLYRRPPMPDLHEMRGMLYGLEDEPLDSTAIDKFAVLAEWLPLVHALLDALSEADLRACIEEFDCRPSHYDLCDRLEAAADALHALEAEHGD
jgi:hypothetical protein